MILDLRSARARLCSTAFWACLLATTSAFAAEAPGIEFHPRSGGYPFSEAVRVGDVLYLSGQIGAAEGDRSVVPGGMEAETRRMMELIGATLARHGLGFEDLFKCTVMLADMGEWAAFNEIYAGYFEPGRYPARSAMGVSGLALGARVEMECQAYAPMPGGP